MLSVKLLFVITKNETWRPAPLVYMDVVGADLDEGKARSYRACHKLEAICTTTTSDVKSVPTITNEMTAPSGSPNNSVVSFAAYTTGNKKRLSIAAPHII